MQVDADTLLINAMRDAIVSGVKAKFTQSYNNPFDAVLADALARHRDTLTALVSDAVGSLVSEPAFRSEVAASVRSAVAKQLVQKFGGELEKTVNQLKSDPATRAKITLAITAIVRERAAI